MIRLKRYEGNPILTGNPTNWWESKYVYNPAAILHEGKVLILYRAEGDEKRRGIETRWPVSRFGVALSEDGYEITARWEQPVMGPTCEDDFWGVEDPRIVKLDDTYYITYVGVSPMGDRLAYATTKDFKTITRGGRLMLEVNQRTSSLMPEKIKGKFALIHRITPSMWVSYSEDLVHWHDTKVIMTPRPGHWDEKKVGIGSQPIRTDKGWLIFYHATDRRDVYRVGIVWLDLEDPSKVVARQEEPALEPLMDYEVHGLTHDVIYPCGAVELGGEYLLYYGGADMVTCVASVPVDEVK